MLRVRGKTGRRLVTAHSRSFDSLFFAPEICDSHASSNLLVQTFLSLAQDLPAFRIILSMPSYQGQSTAVNDFIHCTYLTCRVVCSVLK